MNAKEEKPKPYDRWNGNPPKECIGKCAIGGPVFYFV
jgi:hypothetical protein